MVLDLLHRKPHVTIQVENLGETPIEELGSFIENHPAFPARVNVGFLQIQDPHHGKFAVWEEGSRTDFSFAERGNCAAAATAIKKRGDGKSCGAGKSWRYLNPRMGRRRNEHLPSRSCRNGGLTVKSEIYR